MTTAIATVSNATIPTPNTAALAAPGAILLVACYELGHQPLTLAAPFAHLRAAGFAPIAVNTAVADLADDAIRRARLVAISVPMHTALRLGSAVAGRVKAVNPAAHVCFFGLYAGLNAEYLLADGRGDSTIAGEYEEPLVALARALNQPEPPTLDILDVPGVGTQHRPALPVLARPTHLVPQRDDLHPLGEYAGLDRDGTIVPAGYVEATRGCHHTCRHCPITPVYGGRFTVVPAEIVLADAGAQIAAGARHITFGDPDFFNGPGHSLRICRALHAAHPDVTFDATIKIEHLLQHHRLIPELAALGCIFVVTAVESLSDHVLSKLDKGHCRADVEAALAVLDNAGIAMRPSLLPFTPWATRADYRELLEFVAANDLQDHVDPVQLTIRLLIPPGSAILDDPDKPWISHLDAEQFTYRWRHPDPEMDRLHAAITKLVEGDVAAGTSAQATFSRIWHVAYDADSRAAPPIPSPTAPRRRPPRLTEHWFC